MLNHVTNFVDWMTEPTRYFALSVVAVFGFLKFRKYTTKISVIIGFFIVGTAFFVFAWSDPNFNRIITKPDNVPIIILLFSVVFFSWLSLRRGYLNDERMKAGMPPMEGDAGKGPVRFWSLGHGAGSAVGPVSAILHDRPWSGVGVELDSAVVELGNEFLPLPVPEAELRHRGFQHEFLDRIFLGWNEVDHLREQSEGIL